MRVVAIVVLSTAVLSVAPRSKAGRAMFLVTAILAATMLLLIDGKIAHWIAMIIGVPSISSLALLADIASTRAFERPLFAANERRILLSTMAIVSLVLYPSALGYIDADVYHLGFEAIAPLVIGAAGVVLAARRDFRLALLAFALLLALDMRVLPSSNVFDYVVDPVGGLAAITWVAVQLGKPASARTLMRFLTGALDAKRETGPEGRRSPAH